jgi:regulator of sirC expression with transglutaminase-like and TPR domain
MGVLLELLAGRNEDAPLDRAALELARIEYPDLNIEPFLQILDSYAVELAGRLGDSTTGAAFVTATNGYLFHELGFAGNAQDYFDPHNSCLNDVLTRRVGIPITLSIVYIEIARRLAKPVFGIGMPGHFLIQYDDGEYSTYIDPFHGGRLLSLEDCFVVAKETAGVDLEPDAKHLPRASARQILFRMASNLRRIYFERQWNSKSIELLNLLIAANPDSAEEYKQRGVVHVQAGNMRTAKTDFERYLTLAPEGSDRSAVEQQLWEIQRWLASMN